MSTAASEEDDYVCQLDAKTAEKAKIELNEDANDRLNAVDALRTWIQQQPHITFKAETPVLLYFLRTTKFSQLRAREMLENYLRAVTQLPRWFRDIDTHDHALADVIDSGYMFPLPRKDALGRRILFYKLAAKKKDGGMFSVEDEVRTLTIVNWYLARDENCQVNGVIHVFDLTGVNSKYMSRWTVDDLRTWRSCLKRSMPGRIKAFHYYNAGTIIDMLMAVARPFLSKKVQERVNVHSTMESLYKCVGMELLPDEYLPDDYQGPSAGPIQHIIQKFKDDVMSSDFRKWLLDHTSVHAHALDESRRPTHNVATGTSYRKLNVD